MIIGTGIDIIEVERIAKAAEKTAFLSRVFTKAEIEFYQAQGKDPQRLAGMFAAKEAISKALGTGIVEMLWVEREISHDEKGKPLVALSGKALAEMQKLGGKRMHISISHLKSVACAQAILEGGE